MKRVIAKCYFDKAKQMYPNEKNKTILMDIAEMLKMTMNSYYGMAKKEACNLDNTGGYKRFQTF